MRIVAIVLSVLMLSSPALAQSTPPGSRRCTRRAGRCRSKPVASPRSRRSSRARQSRAGPDRPPARFLGGIAGGVGGFFGGAYLGAALEPDCNCDDPGFRGFLIGAPIGAVAGAILGAKYF